MRRDLSKLSEVRGAQVKDGRDPYQSECQVGLPLSSRDVVTAAAGQFGPLCFDNLKGAADKFQLF